ncbi:hypothetical protein PSN45_004085 [Yamadazyma tenuis]|uniref:Importin N-terminal domain-containing protein n=1 Tax=Candida tenuis (strain ATCC 10573 / BCRC 21748 / CBS 615 / JCM 9827 / NBRC 10315 / NRRL Y-1498 / VKM Y-70) TaxID=590646 RepID=G3B4J0_CANTC|nr:uncharacterized protein CANTEDRAFT_130228 [Yamadazyma tenuis ATCC 10573]EGV63841.1 hypothetical protein CANTEDRAFT_130228 [Yamadazyma tenuis ATCC 10573]WEJ96546.1 hypothetical protein PSN45_004085 [Yamadazyma tenuis]
MDQVQLVLKLIEDQNSSNNNSRRVAELEFNHLVAQDPSKVCYVLIQVPMESSYPQYVRQSCLLHLRRLVPKYWSMAFESFSGTPISQDLKSVIRDNLIKLVMTSQPSKIKNSASYVIVQIAVADYPDEWPDLLNTLYEYSRDFNNQPAVEGSLKVLNDLFDDLVTEEQFWDQNVGKQLIDHITSILSTDNLSPEVKINCIDLYKNVLNYLTSGEAFVNDSRKKMVYEHLPFICELFFKLIKDSIQSSSKLLSNKSIDLVDCKFRSSMYSVLSTIFGSFNKKISIEFKRYLLLELLGDFNVLHSPYLQINNSTSDLSIIGYGDDYGKDITDTINEIASLVLLIQHSVQLNSVLATDDFSVFVTQMISVSTLQSEDSYDNDFNVYITENTGLSGSVTVRDSINEFFSELNDKDSNAIFNAILRDLMSSTNDPWELTEAKFYILESMFQNEDTELEGDIDITDFYSFTVQFLALNEANRLNSNTNSLVIARVISMLPKFFEKFEGKLSVNKVSAYRDDIANYNNNIAAFIFSLTIFISCKLSSGDTGYDFIKASTLISSTNYRDLINFETDFNHTNSTSIQQNFFCLITDLLEASEEDALPVLLEALSVGININPKTASKTDASGSSVVDLILNVSFKDPSNVQSVIESSDCLRTLFENIEMADYITCCEKSLPFLINNINQSATDSQSVEYSPKLNLSLDLLDIVIESVPPNEINEKSFPEQVFNFLYSHIRRLVILANDDQILQSGGSIINSLIQNASTSFRTYKDPDTGESGLESLLTIVSKFLSSELSDRAALNCGTIVTSLINKFQQELGDQYLSQILAATAQRLLIAKEVITVENLVMLFCNLVLVSPESMINYLGNELILKDPVTGKDTPSLSLILPIWFQSFEVTRGYEKIKQNALALGKIFSLADQRIETLVVNGDLIPYDGDKIVTRSMTKSMPDRYTQISASLKILKLLVSELEFQCQQPNAEDYLQGKYEEDAGDDDGWEDLEDIGVPNYDKLKSYIDSDDEEHEESKDDDLKNLLIQFFKECAVRNLGNFSKYYGQLDDGEKRIITENVLF